MNAMKWVATSEEMPAVGRRVLCAMYADTEYGFPVCGLFDGEYWIVDDVQQLVDTKKGGVLVPDCTHTKKGEITWI